jgi:hypothetical protein
MWPIAFFTTKQEEAQERGPDGAGWIICVRSRAITYAIKCATKLDFGHSGGLAKRVNQASLKGL